MAINRLPPSVVARIAAGEVVERPSSAVKELVENALDAGARRIVIEVEGGGADMIQVSDDGRGISPDDLPLAFERHATSKLASDDDLDQIGTLGFRGEALPSIAAVADVDCISRVAAEPHAWRLRVRGGVSQPLEPVTRASGTTMTVRGLFADLPARRKFLRGRATESAHTLTACTQLALAYPEVAFQVRVDGRASLETAGDGDLIGVVAAVHGRDAAAAMVSIPADDEPSTVSVRGCASNGSATLPTRSGVTVLVNRRPVQSRSLGYAVDEAYRTLVPVGRHPIVVLDLLVPPSQVDVNVHPRKSEVRLLHERAVFAAVQRSILRGLSTVPTTRQTGLDVDGALDGYADAESWFMGLRVLGQVAATYIIAEGGSGLYLVDQHAAHERVLYEALRESWNRPAAMQALLTPSVVELAPREAALIGEHLVDARLLGYDVEPFGDGALLVRAVPAALASRDPLTTLKSAISSLSDEAAPADWRDRLAILFACHNAVRAGDRLTDDEMAALLEQLGEAELCQACSHGRPTAVHLSHSQLAREFGRPV